MESIIRVRGKPTGIARGAVLHHQIHIGNIDTAGRYISRHEHLELILSELVDSQIALMLTNIPMKHLNIAVP